MTISRKCRTILGMSIISNLKEGWRADRLVNHPKSYEVVGKGEQEFIDAFTQARSAMAARTGHYGYPSYSQPTSETRILELEDGKELVVVVEQVRLRSLGSHMGRGIQPSRETSRQVFSTFMARNLIGALDLSDNVEELLKRATSSRMVTDSRRYHGSYTELYLPDDNQGFGVFLYNPNSSNRRTSSRRNDLVYYALNGHARGYLEDPI